jgi:hypothetical protein
MKKILSFLLILTITVHNVHAQSTIANGNMENWTNVGSNTEEPQFWNSNKTGGGASR